MELLPNEFKAIAIRNGLELKQIEAIIGSNLMNVHIEIDTNNLEWRENPTQKLGKSAIWELIRESKHSYEASKISRRSVINKGQLFFDLNKENCVNLELTPNHTIIVNSFQSTKAYVNGIIQPFKGYQTIDQEVKSISDLSSAEFSLILALIELFLKENPIPKTEWIPEELVLFTSGQLLELIEESTTKVETSTWYNHWQRIHPATFPKKEDLDTACYMLNAKGLIGLVDGIEEEIRYIGKDLLWIIRSIVWWDRGYLLRNIKNHTSITLIQASSLFIILNDKDKNFDIININFESLEQIVSEFLSISEHIVIKEENSNSRSTPKFCTQCGQAIVPKAKFCTNCGHKIFN